jgi:hypothetical protein
MPTTPPGGGGGAPLPHDPARRAGQHGVLAPEAARLAQAAPGLHEHQSHTVQLSGHLVHITAQDGGEIGVDHGRVASRYQLDQRAHLVRAADLRKADGAGRLRDGRLVRGIAVAVQKDHRGAAEPVHVRRGQRLARGVQVERADEFAVCAHPFLHLDHPVVEGLRKQDPPVENAGAVLVGDAQGVPEAAGDDQDGRLAGVCQQRVGGDGGAHLHHLDTVARDRLVRLQA